MASALERYGVKVRWVTGEASPSWASAAIALEEGGDCLVVHNTHGTPDWSLQLVEQAPHFKKVFVLHDEWTFTGGCAFTHTCNGHMWGCNNCPGGQFDYPHFNNEFAATEWSRKRKFIARNPDIEVIAPSEWIQERAHNGLWHGHKIHHIPYPAPLDTFYPEGVMEAREELVLPQDKMVYCLIAQNLEDCRKGAYDVGRFNDAYLVAMGHGRPDGYDRYMPHDTSVEARRKLLSAADYNLHLALADNYPNTIIEASCCNTTTLSPREPGGVAEMIHTETPRKFVEENNNPGIIGKLLLEAMR